MIAPASWFFSMCYRITGRVMSAAQRDKFQMIKPDELESKLHVHIDPQYLPEHLGGSNSNNYTTTVNVHFDPVLCGFVDKPKK
jgi:hypothetical protein